MRLVFCLGLLFVCAPIAAQAQSRAASFALTGVALDQNDAALPNARVTLRSEGDGQTRSAKTDAAGVFRFDMLAAGEYELTVEREGFKRVIERVTITARQPAPMRI